MMSKIKNIIVLFIKWIRRNLFILLFLAIFVLVFLFINDTIEVSHHFKKDNEKGELIKVCLTAIAGFGALGALYYSARRVRVMEKGNVDNRFKDAVTLLGNIHTSARIGGVYNLYFLANEYPNEYLEPACEILCAHIRTITGEKEYQEKYKEKTSTEIQTILDLLFHKDYNLIFNECWKNLEGAFLNGANFQFGKLRNVNFIKTNLSGVFFNNATLGDVDFSLGAILSDVLFSDTTLNKVYFSYTALIDVDFNNAILSNVFFNNATLIDVDFEGAKFEKKIDFSGTLLESYKSEEITREGRSLELTKSKEENK